MDARRRVERTTTEARGLAWSSGMTGRSGTRGACRKAGWELETGCTRKQDKDTRALWVYVERAGATPIHLAPGRETAQRRGYWASAWETRSAHPCDNKQHRLRNAQAVLFVQNLYLNRIYKRRVTPVAGPSSCWSVDEPCADPLWPTWFACWLLVNLPT